MKNRIIKKNIMKNARVLQNREFKNRISTGCCMGGVCEAKIKMLKENNSSLARALSDQKIETNHWYTEAISLKGELQESQERQLRMPCNNLNVENLFGPIEKQVKAHYETIDKDVNAALDRLVHVVENLTKIKQLVGTTQNILQNSFQGSSNIFTRTPGSRIPLGSSGFIGSPRQRAVPPMVSGHVLQPAMVNLPKLKIDWNDRNRFVVNEDTANLSTIGEQASPGNYEVNEEQESVDAEENDQPQNDVTATPTDIMVESQSQNEVDTTNPQTNYRPSTSKRYSLRCNTSSSPEVQIIKAVPVRSSNRRRFPSRRCLESNEWRKPTSCSKMSNTSTFAESEHMGEEKEVHTPKPVDDPLEGPSWLFDERGFYSRRIKPQKKKCARTAVINVSLESSNEDEGLDISPKLKKGRSRFRKKVVSSSTTSMDDTSPLLDQSSCDSPTSMFTRLETLEVTGGRKSKRFIKKRKHFTKSQSLDVNNEDRTHAEENSIPNNNKVSYSTSSESESESPEVLREENDVTCQVVSNMELTLPVPNTVIEDNAALEKSIDDLQDELKSTQSKNKFFKREVELFKEIPKIVERTPFDLSMLDESTINMAAFSSTRTEKENLPPLSSEDCNKYASLYDVSVVLEDVMKRPTLEKQGKSCKLTPKESQSPKLRKLKHVSRAYDVNYTSLDVKIQRKSEIKQPHNNDDTHIEVTESGDKKTYVPLPDTIRKEGLEECFVLVHRTPIVGSPFSEVNKNETPGNVQNNPTDQLQQPTDKMMSLHGQEEVEGATSDTGPGSPSNSPSSTPVNTERNINLIEKNVEEQNRHESEIQDCISNAEEPAEGCRRTSKRTAVRVSTFKEVSLNSKMRRGENDTIIISKGSSRGRGRGRRKRKEEKIAKAE